MLSINGEFSVDLHGTQKKDIELIGAMNYLYIKKDYFYVHVTALTKIQPLDLNNANPSFPHSFSG